MRRTSRTLGCLLIALASSASLAACRDAVTGQGGNGLNPTFVGIEASSGVSGANPTGTVTFRFGGGNEASWHGDASCLSVRGNTAIVGFGEGYYRLGLPITAYWVKGLVRIVDNGPGPGDTFEYVELETGPPSPNGTTPPPGDPLPGPTDCSTFPPDRTAYVLTVGDGFRINDAQPLRVSKD
jgi:hypothetical protein